MKKSISLENMTDVFGGKINAVQLENEIRFQMYHKTPSKLVVEIKRSKKYEGYYTTIYIPIKDFERIWK